MPYMQNGKKISLRVTDVEDNFTYNVAKSQMKKGSTVSKNLHPVKQVEEMKDRLLSTGKMTDSGSCYTLKRTITTGLLMAKNLHYGRLINSQSEDWKRDGYYAFASKKIEEEIKFRNLATSDSIMAKARFLDGLRIKEIDKIRLDFSCISEHNGDEFSPIEKLFFDELSRRGIISKNARHGSANDDECDIVDEKNNLQIEVVTEFKNRLKKSKTPQKDYDSLGLECVGNVFIQPSKALLDKYYEKNYTNKYKKHLAIYCLGNRDAVIGLSYAIKERFKQQGETKNDFEDLYIIWNDFVDGNKTYIMYFMGDNKEPVIEEIFTDVGLIKECGKITYSDLKDDEHYFWNTESIFGDKNTAIGILPGYEIRKNVERLRIVT